MIRLLAFILVGCVVCAGLILIEFGSISNRRPSPGARLPPAELEPAAPEIRKLADPLFSPTQRRPETASLANDADLPLRDVRLTGVVIGQDLRIAIFAVTGTNSRVLSEGEALKGWRLESISPEGVVLSGLAGNKCSSLSRMRIWFDRLRLLRSSPASPARRWLVPGQPMAVTPIAVGNLSAATPVQTQGYPDYSPGCYPGYDPYCPWGWGWGWPVGVSVGFGGCWNCGFRGGSTSDSGLLAYRELDDALALTLSGGGRLAETRTGRTRRHLLVGYCGSRSSGGWPATRT